MVQDESVGPGKRTRRHTEMSTSNIGSETHYEFLGPWLTLSAMVTRFLPWRSLWTTGMTLLGSLTISNCWLLNIDDERLGWRRTMLIEVALATFTTRCTVGAHEERL